MKGLIFGTINIGTCRGKEEGIIELMKRRKLDVIGISKTRKKIGLLFMPIIYKYIGSGENIGRHGVGITVRDEFAGFVGRY